LRGADDKLSNERRWRREKNLKDYGNFLMTSSKLCAAIITCSQIDQKIVSLITQSESYLDHAGRKHVAWIRQLLQFMMAFLFPRTRNHVSFWLRREKEDDSSSSNNIKATTTFLWQNVCLIRSRESRQDAEGKL